MNIHELYNLKQQQYTQYQIDKGVWDSKLQESQTKLLKSVQGLAEAIEQLDDFNIKSRASGIIKMLTDSKDNLTNEVLSKAKNDLEVLCSYVEQEIRKVLQ